MDRKELERLLDAALLREILASFAFWIWLLSAVRIDNLTPGEAVFGLLLPGVSINLEFFKNGFQRVFIPLFLSSNCALAIPKLPIEYLFEKSVNRHSQNMFRPSCLGPKEHGMHRVDAGLLKNSVSSTVSCNLM